MPPLTAELAGLIAVATLLLTFALITDPRLRAQRAVNRRARARAARRDERGDAVPLTALVLLIMFVGALIFTDSAVTLADVTGAIEGVLR